MKKNTGNDSGSLSQKEQGMTFWEESEMDTLGVVIKPDPGFQSEIEVDNSEPSNVCDQDLFCLSGIEFNQIIRVVAEGDEPFLLVHEEDCLIVNKDNAVQVSLTGEETFNIDFSRPGKIYYDNLDLDRVGAFRAGSEAPDRIVAEGETVEVMEFACGPDMDQMTFCWTQEAGPEVDFPNGLDQPVLTFTVPPGSKGKTLTFELVISSQTGVSVFCYSIGVESQ